MTDLFSEKAQDWDSRDRVQILSKGIGEAILRQVSWSDDMWAMDFGAGTGLLTEHVAPKVKGLVAIDTSQAMLTKLSEKEHLQDKVRPVCQNILETPLTQKFDLIVSAMAMHHVEDTAALMLTFSEHLKPGGQIALADLDTEAGDFHPANTEGVFHAGFDRDKLKQLAETHGFQSVKISTAHTVKKEGKLYPIFVLTACKK